MSKQNTKLIEATMDGIDANLILPRAGNKKAKLYRLILQNSRYFAARDDIDTVAFERIDQLQLGATVRVCTFEHRGRRKIAWIRSAHRGIAPYDLIGQRRRNLTLLLISVSVLAASLVVTGIRVPLILALATFMAIVSLLGCVISIGGLIESLSAARREAQERWQAEPYRFEVKGRNR